MVTQHPCSHDTPPPEITPQSASELQLWQQYGKPSTDPRNWPLGQHDPPHPTAPSLQHIWPPLPFETHDCPSPQQSVPPQGVVPPEQQSQLFRLRHCSPSVQHPTDCPGPGGSKKFELVSPPQPTAQQGPPARSQTYLRASISAAVQAAMVA